MKKVIIVIGLLVSIVAMGCHTERAANRRISDCLEEEHGEERAEEMLSDWEINCDDLADDEACDECIDCIIDESCADILDGTCSETCAS
jgi:hypothetical protein